MKDRLIRLGKVIDCVTLQKKTELGYLRLTIIDQNDKNKKIKYNETTAGYGVVTICTK